MKRPAESYRIRAVEYHLEGNTLKQTCLVFKIGATTLKNWKKKYRETGAIKDKTPVRDFKKIDPQQLKAYVQAHPDAYQYEIAQVFGCCQKAIWQALRKQGITRKKNSNATKSKTVPKSKNT